jgi:hypothetical protein
MKFFSLYSTLNFSDQQSLQTWEQRLYPKNHYIDRNDDERWKYLTDISYRQCGYEMEKNTQNNTRRLVKKKKQKNN